MTGPSDSEAACPALIADIGGTNVRFALVYGGEVHETHVLACRDFSGPAEAAQAYLKDVRPAAAPAAGAFGVASLVTDDQVRLTNHPWSFSIEATRRELGLESLRTINDVLALTLAVPHLAPEDTEAIGSGSHMPAAPIAVVAPGTGLGAAALIPTSGGWTPVATEAGHVSLPPVTPFEAEILTRLSNRFGHVSVERAVSGPGLVNLYLAICEIEGADADDRIVPAEVTKRGSDGTCKQCAAALTTFSCLLGTFAGDIALTFCARGGVYIGGGVVPRLGQAFDATAFRKRFEQKGRFSDYLAAIPTHLITHPTPALIGLARSV